MYSWEITQTMEQYNYNLPSNIYIDITENSPQINHISYNACNGRLEMWGTEGEYWNFAVYLQQEAA